MSELPEPLVSASIDLTDFPFMPIMIARLKQSRAWLVCKRRPELAFYMINLWTASWHGKPAGSLEDDELVLADLAMCPSPKVWNKVKGEVLRGWVRCGDGRIYHPVVAEQAKKAWDGKTSRRAQTEAARVAREAARARAQAERQQRLTEKTHDVTDTETSPVTDGETQDVSSSKGQGQGQGQGQGEGRENACAAARAGPSGRSRLEIDCRAAVGEEPVLLAQDFHTLVALLGEGLREEDILTGIREALERSDPQKRYRHWGSFVNWCRTAAQNRLVGASPSRRDPTETKDASGEPRFDFGNTYSAPYSAIRNLWSQRRWLVEWGPRPDEPDCRISRRVMDEVMREPVDA